MENLQKQVRQTQAFGVAGEVAKGIHSFYLAETRPLGEENVVAGGFVQTMANSNAVKGASGVAVNGKILGVCLKEHYSGAYNANELYSMPDNVAILTKGAVYIETEIVCNVGQFVFIKNDNGKLAFGDTKELADHTYTGFKVMVGTGAQLDSVGHDIIVVVSE